MFSEDEMKEIIKEDFNYPDDMIEDALEKIHDFDEELKMEFEDWLENGVLSDRVIEGFSLPLLMKEYNMNIIGAFLTMDWIGKEPETAMEALNYGYDYVE